ncbi:MAG: YdcF family protein [Flavobacteriales bacterium]|nr:YdcF family protein [Flavobacteriales bacterium]
MYYNLSISEYKLTEKPAYIIVMSGGGIPSESGLMRTYRAAELANKLPYTKIIVTMPGDTTDTNSACYLMKKELIIRGISKTRILFENKGANTRSQALAVQEMLPNNPPIIIVSSPEHIYRSLKTFKKAGLTNLTGKAAFPTPVKASFLFNDQDLGGNNTILNIGNNTQLRYQFWSHLKFQIIVYREYTAIFFYKLNGWI